MFFDLFAPLFQQVFVYNCPLYNNNFHLYDCREPAVVLVRLL